MSKFDLRSRIGLRDKETKEIVAVYPDPIVGTDKEIEDKVKFWFYQQNCAAEDKLKDYYVDNLTENEEKRYNQK